MGEEIVKEKVTPESASARKPMNNGMDDMRNKRGVTAPKERYEVGSRYQEPGLAMSGCVCVKEPECEKILKIKIRQ